MKKLWCIFRRRDAEGKKICVADAEDGRVIYCKYATEEEAREKCPDYAYNNRNDGDEEGVE